MLLRNGPFSHDDGKRQDKMGINQNAYMHAVYIFFRGLKQDIYNGRKRQRRSYDRERLHMDDYRQLHNIEPCKQLHNQFQRLYHNTYRQHGAELSEKGRRG